MPSVTRRAAAGARRRAAVEAEVLEATERLLREGASFTELGVQRLAAEAGVARSTFYVHFPDKTALLLRLVETLSDGAYELIAAAPPGDGVEAMAAAMAEVTRYYRERRHLLAAIIEVAAYDPAAREFWDGRLQHFIDRAEQWLRDAQANGDTSPSLDAPTAARVFVWGGFQALVNQVLTGPADQDDVVAKEIALIEWHGAFRRPTT
jgi:AcrR family transcriptional regulator